MFSQLRLSWLFGFVASGAWLTWPGQSVAQPHVPLAVCSVIDRDNDFEGEDDSRPVVLMVRGKFQKPAGAQENVLDLQIDEVLFGNDPGRVIRFECLPRHKYFEWYVGQNVLDSGIYSFACTRRDGRLAYDSDAYRFLHRHMPDSELTAARAIAAARFDRLVLCCRAIVVGRPKTAVDTNDKQPRMSNAGPLDIYHPPTSDGIKLPSDALGILTNDDAHEQNIGSRKQTVVVERVLFGSFKPGDEFVAQLGYRATPIPLSGDGPFVYFIADDLNGVKKLETVWNVDAEPQVRASLARRKQHPVVKSEAPQGKSAQREIQFLGTTPEAIALLDANEGMARQLGLDRLLQGGPQVRKDIVRAIEANFFLVREDGAAERFRSNYYQPWRLIRLLGKLEREQSTGEIPRLIDLMLAQAHAGDAFPLQPVDLEVPEHFRRRFNPYASFDVDANHCLAWLLKELPPKIAAHRYLEPLKELRDLTPYGWGQEAQAIIDRLQLEDRLTLPAALQAPEAYKPIAMWQSAATPTDIVELRFASDNITVGVQLESGLRRIWNSATGKLLREEQGPAKQRSEEQHDTVEWLAEDGRRWTFFEDNHAYHYKGEGYGPPGAIDIVVTAHDEQAGWSRDVDFGMDDGWGIEKLHPGLVGRVELVTLEHAPPCGLVPGNEWLFVRTNIYSRKDLRQISSANVLGNVDGINFSAKGERYAVITTNDRDDPDPEQEFDDDFPVFRLNRRDERKSAPTDHYLRVLDSESGRTLFATKSADEWLKVALSPNGRRVAAVNARRELVVWDVPEVPAKPGSR